MPLIVVHPDIQFFVSPSFWNVTLWYYLGDQVNPHRRSIRLRHLNDLGHVAPNYRKKRRKGGSERERERTFQELHHFVFPCVCAHARTSSHIYVFRWRWGSTFFLLLNFGENILTAPFTRDANFIDHYGVRRWIFFFYRSFCMCAGLVGWVIVDGSWDCLGEFILVSDV